MRWADTRSRSQSTAARAQLNDHCQEHNEPDNGDERHYQGFAAGCTPHESSDAFGLTHSTFGGITRDVCPSPSAKAAVIAQAEIIKVTAA